MPEWSSMTLKDIAEFNPRESVKKGEVAVKIGMDKLQPFCRDIVEIEYEKFNGGTKFRNGDTIMARITPCLENGKTAMVNVLEKNQVGFGSTEYIVFRAKEGKTDPYFLYYLVCSPAVREPAIKSMVGSSGRQRVQIDVVQNLELKIPTLGEQKRIGEFLRKLDDKIAINNQINRNLSEQMQTIFSSIFYSELEVGNKESLGDYLYIKGRIGWKGLKKDEYLNESEYRIINGESLTVSGIDWNKAGYISEERYTESPEIMLQEGDILISKDGTIGKIGYVYKLDKPTSVASGIFVVRNLKAEVISTVFIYCLFNSNYFKSFIASRTEGSVIPHLYQKDFVTLEIPILSQEQLVMFNETVNPLFELFHTKQMENLRLKALRDALLPKLMSGELDVSDL